MYWTYSARPRCSPIPTLKLCGTRRQEIEQAAKRIAELERQVSTLQEGIAKAEALGDRQHQKAQTSANRADQLLAEIIEMTGEFTEM